MTKFRQILDIFRRNLDEMGVWTKWWSLDEMVIRPLDKMVFRWNSFRWNVMDPFMISRVNFLKMCHPGH